MKATQMANEAKADGFYRFVEPVRAIFLNVLKTTTPKLKGGRQGKPSFNGTFLLVPESKDWQGARAKAAEVAKAAFPGRALNDGSIGFPFASGDKKAAEIAKEGKYDPSMWAGFSIFNAHTAPEKPPQLGLVIGGKLISLSDPSIVAQYGPKFYHGCYVWPQVNFVAWERVQDDGKDNVTAYLQAVLWAKDGPHIGRPALEDIFKDYVGAVTDVDPTGGGDNKIPF